MTDRPPIAGLGHSPQAFRASDGNWNIHAGCVAFGASAFIVSGPASAGKTTLCHKLVDEGANWVADDRLIMVAGTSSIELRCSPALQGLVERPGAGPVRIDGMTSVRVPYDNLRWIDLSGWPPTSQHRDICVFGHNVRCVQMGMRPDCDVRALARMADL